MMQLQSEARQKRKGEVGVLRGADVERSQIIPPPQLLDDRSELDDLGTGPKNTGDAKAFGDWRGGWIGGLKMLHTASMSFMEIIATFFCKTYKFHKSAARGFSLGSCLFRRPGRAPVGRRRGWHLPGAVVLERIWNRVYSFP